MSAPVPRCVVCGDPCQERACRHCLWWDCFATALELGVLGADCSRMFRRREPVIDVPNALKKLARRVAELEHTIEAM